ncbi:MAG TPA: K(+)-transporting ATPase subunit C [Thermoanaerobaculia bacterium]|jgi:K+-transporting ATPase ATPase C chain|nr:K(+)-transporting ATPase subunit C [Thermoanaerobaculia bacterium]
MKETIIAIRMTLVLLVVVSGIDPAAVWAVGQLAFPNRANGSFVVRDGRRIGSELIGQPFTSPRFFHPRPSAAGKDGYDPRASGGTNLGPTSKVLRDAIAARIGGRTNVPADAVTASASGVDPHISPANAYGQAARIARANAIPESEVRALIDRHIEGRFLGIYGEPRVNVLKLNLDLLSRQ